MSARVASLILTPGSSKPRLVLLADGRRKLTSAVEVLRMLREVGGEEICDHLATYLSRLVERHAPPAKLPRKPRSDRRAKQQPRGDA
jgi:MoxR-like ATPase